MEETPSPQASSSPPPGPAPAGGTPGQPVPPPGTPAPGQAKPASAAEPAPAESRQPVEPASAEPAPAEPAPAEPKPDERPPAPAGGKAGKTGKAGNPARPTALLRIGSPDTVLAVIPGLLGFHPAKSLVVVGAGPPRGRIQVAFRYDLPEPPDVGAAAKIAAHAAAILARHQLTLAIVVGYGPGPMVTPVADALVAELRRADIALHDVLRVENGRYWSYSCRDPRCCPAEGVPFDVSAHPAAAAMAEAGNKALRDRAALAASIAPLRGLVEESMRQATRRAERRAARLIRDGAASGRERGVVERLVGEGLRAVSEAIGVYRRGGKLGGDDRIAWLAVALTDLRVRDDAWARMIPEHVQAHLRLWTDVVRRVPARYVAAPASLLAFSAWQAGNGALANVAAQRALAADPEYSMALLLLDAIGAGVPPSAARLPMTPEEVAASYARADDPEPGEPPSQRPAPRGGARAPRRKRPAGQPGPATESPGYPSGSPEGTGGTSSGSRRPSGSDGDPAGGPSHTPVGGRGPAGGFSGPSAGDRGSRAPSGGGRGSPGSSRSRADGARGPSSSAAKKRLAR